MPFGKAPTCDDLLETGDLVTTAETTLSGNSYFQNLPDNDGTWTVKDEVSLPWFTRESPNTTSEPEVSRFGRHTFFGDANSDPVFHEPATPVGRPQALLPNRVPTSPTSNHRRELITA